MRKSKKTRNKEQIELNFQAMATADNFKAFQLDDRPRKLDKPCKSLQLDDRPRKLDKPCKSLQLDDRPRKLDKPCESLQLDDRPKKLDKSCKLLTPNKAEPSNTGLPPESSKSKVDERACGQKEAEGAFFDNLITVEELAVIFGLAPQTIRNWVAQGKLPYVRLGKRNMFLTGSLQKWLNRKEEPQWQ